MSKGRNLHKQYKAELLVLALVGRLMPFCPLFPCVPWSRGVPCVPCVPCWPSDISESKNAGKQWTKRHKSNC